MRSIWETGRMESTVRPRTDNGLRSALLRGSGAAVLHGAAGAEPQSVRGVVDAAAGVGGDAGLRSRGAVAGFPMTISGSNITTTPASRRKASGPISMGASRAAGDSPEVGAAVPCRWTSRAAMPV
ncbi:hypothetical protein GCM10011428_59190 [Streptomyces violaceus]